MNNQKKERWFSKYFGFRPGDMWLIIRTFFSLNSYQHKILQSQKVEGAFTPEYWLQLLQKIAHYDQFTDKVRVPLRNWSFLVLVFNYLLIPFLLFVIFQGEIQRHYYDNTSSVLPELYFMCCCGVPTFPISFG